MIIKNKLQTQEIRNGDLIFRILESGDIYSIEYYDHQINLLNGNIIDGSIANIYLRIFQDDKISYTKLIGTHSPSSFELFSDRIIYFGEFENIKYQVTLTVEKMTWQYDISVKSDKTVTFDLIYGQDVAISNKGSILSSEAYTVQYIDYKVFNHQNGYVLCARQNQGKPQYLQLGSHHPNVAYTTDGFQFFGLSFKETGCPQAMTEERLVSEIYQYEFSYMSLQSDKNIIDGNEVNYSFYGHYQDDHQKVIENYYEIKQLETELKWRETIFEKRSKSLLNTSNQLNGKHLEYHQIKDEFKEISLEEYHEDQLISFFTANHHHVVLKQKELLVERPHGHLLLHGDIKHVSENVMASTNFMFGVFSSHVVLGNTSFNKLTGSLRNPLNITKISGQRIYVNIKGVYYILGIPSYYDIGVNSTKWVYVIENDVLTVEVFAHIDDMQQTLHVYSKKGNQYDFIVTNQLLMGPNEYAYDIPIEVNDDEINILLPKDSMAIHRYPHLKYKFIIGQPFSLIDEEEAFNITNQFGLLMIKIEKQTQFSIDVLATINDKFQQPLKKAYKKVDDEGTLYFKSFTHHFNLTQKKDNENLRKTNHIVFWYTHNALTHYASPHGLEQSNGAAWGTRDICQGPIEFFSTTQNYDIVREIILKVYQRQFIETGDFPQWYMFDKYYQIQAHDSHGDIIIWPLRSLAYYLKATNDFSILEEQIPYMSLELNDFTEKTSLMEHLKLQIETMIESFIPNTYLPAYGGGDWDDTLQPANHDLTKIMVSGWTVSLLYEALNQLSIELNDYDKSYSIEVKTLAQNIKKDYEKHIIADGIPSGFVVFNNEEKTYLLHPRDQKTGLKYRLLPFTRALISEISNQSQVETYMQIINKQFKHPDGVRLMDTTVAYKSGKMTYFTRAETAANFGREIGLQYVHAHIRYIEAMAKIGKADEAFEGLLTINPILIEKQVPNAYYRQSNVYFSSSDAWFKDRYEAKKDFHKIKSGEIKAKGGWRLYSSGPGIYLNQLISNFLGIRIEHQHLVIDPVLPKKLDGLVLEYNYLDKPIEIHYHYGSENHRINNQPLPFKPYMQKYRHSGIIIDRKVIENIKTNIKLDIWYK
jgi:1,2-beta-oligoglucan phosphorylase